MHVPLSYDEEQRWLAEHVAELSRYARRGYQRMGRGVVQIRLDWTDPETRVCADIRFDYRADSNPPPGERSWFGEDAGRRVATYDPKTECIAVFYYTPDDPNADALARIHTWRLDGGMPQILTLDQARELPGFAYAAWRRKLGLGWTPLTNDDLGQAYALVQDGASGDELRAFFASIAARAMDEEGRLRAN
jgi:hypothetical protein